MHRPYGPLEHRRAAALLALSILPAAAAAQPSSYPSKPVQIIVSWAAGGSIDTMARGFARAMSQELAQPVVVENRDGASGMIGTAATVSAPPDGYVLNFGPITPITNALHLVSKPAYGIDSLEYVCQVFENRFAIAVPQNSPYKTLQDLFAAIQASPGKLSYGHLGVGSITHLSLETAIQGRNFSVTGVPYRGETPMFLDLQTSRLDFGIVTVGNTLATSRPVRMLAIISERRHPEMPGVPTLKELGLPSLQPALVGLMAPKGTPAPVLAKLEAACKKAVETDVMQSAVKTLRDEIVYKDRKAFTQSVMRDYEEKGALVRRLAISPQN
ncbi:MAG: tripartite tricarboxylate transporter substrate binding protein [Pigmentiphaga sp.]|uniref:tripartite tricarboxylate transporter substrate binding protein n=1 Tax=Pigmentiphaga sp. TaxID=1977564 RepID=UPI00299FA64E|nr:tripartite tricarboxylate transporter substrate binding protein [Pigmentiphaga sp.]MDX3906404.1 tripartite tricarboxylate transporter substrate binding protein [Pigmentiphaga sp.]